MLAILMTAAGICLGLAIALFAAVALCACVKRPRKRSGCIIVLGARVRRDGSMSRSLQSRCDAAYDAWRSGVAEHVIVCGGRVGDAPCTEAGVMAAYLLRLGMPEGAVIPEDASRNTVENLRYAREIMERRGFADAAIVTSDYHVQRAIWIARKFSIRACGVAARFPQKPAARLKNLLRECASWLVFWYYELFPPKGET